jgi:hypothetical protein
MLLIFLCVKLLGDGKWRGFSNQFLVDELV